MTLCQKGGESPDNGPLPEDKWTALIDRLFGNQPLWAIESSGKSGSARHLKGIIFVEVHAA
jgi:hypothetical protein